jgi:Ca-activated chloride channel family protein
MNFNLADPRMLWMLPVVVLPLTAFLWWSWRKRQELVTQFISARLLAQLKVGVSPSRQKARLVMLVLAVVCLILAVARPQWGYTWEEARQRGLDILIAIDTSNSMLARDVAPNRLERAKLAALDLMRKAQSDRLGLIAFAGDAFLVCPLTVDDSAFGQSVESLDTHTISRGGTAVASAIDAAQEAFKDEPDNHKVLVLFTDGEDLEGGALSAAEAAASQGMKIYTVGVGTPEGELIEVQNDQGQTDYIRDESGNPVRSHLNETLLEEIAEKAGGFYVPLHGTGTADILYNNPKGLGSLPKSNTSSKTLRRYKERYQWLVGLAIILLVAEIFLPDRKRRRSRSSGASPSAGDAGASGPAAATLAKAAVAVLIVLLPVCASARQSRALREYNEGNYQGALDDYDRLLQSGKSDPRLHFNAGAAAYQSRDFDQAVKEFNQALDSQDLQLQQRAYYNLGNAYFRLGQHAGAASQAPQGVPSAGMDPQAIQKNWEEALKQYESALKLNPEDGDAKFNHDFVQKMIEQLKKQQQQQQNQDKSGNKQDQQNKNNSGQNQDNKDQQQQQQQSQQSQQGNQNKNSQQQNSQSQNQQQQNQAAANKQNDQKKQSEAESADKKNQGKSAGSEDKSQDKSQDEAQREAAMMAAGEMTPRQAQQLLDSQKSEDQVLRLAPPDNKDSASSPPLRNW